jgi:hypothetical protein
MSSLIMSSTSISHHPSGSSLSLKYYTLMYCKQSNVSARWLGSNINVLPLTPKTHDIFSSRCNQKKERKRWCSAWPEPMHYYIPCSTTHTNPMSCEMVSPVSLWVVPWTWVATVHTHYSAHTLPTSRDTCYQSGEQCCVRDEERHLPVGTCVVWAR